MNNKPANQRFFDRVLIKLSEVFRPLAAAERKQKAIDRQYDAAMANWKAGTVNGIQSDPPCPPNRISYQGWSGRIDL